MTLVMTWRGLEMRKFPSSNDPRPARLTPEVLEIVKRVLREFPPGDQEPTLELRLDTVKEKVKSQNASVKNVGDQIVLALEELTSRRLIKGNDGGFGVWDINWISPKL